MRWMIVPATIATPMICAKTVIVGRHLGRVVVNFFNIFLDFYNYFYIFAANSNK